MRLYLDAHSPLPIRWQLTEQLKHAIEDGGVPRDEALPSIRELAGFLSIARATVFGLIPSEDFKAERARGRAAGKGVFVAATRSTPRDAFFEGGDQRGGPREAS
jgi:GntR family transcriptional regulator